MTISEYFKAQKGNLENLSAWEPFDRLFPPVDALYSLAIGMVPSGRSPIFGQILLICHRSFLSAAALIGQAQPDDAGPITRRAIEAARFSAAAKTNPHKAEESMELRKRLQRWSDRAESKKPERLSHRADDIDSSIRPVTDGLKGMLGALSDADVHFTPEFLSKLPWDKRNGSIYLSYFTTDQSELQRSIVFTSAAHQSILKVIDWCFDGVLESNSDWQTLLCHVADEGLRWQGNQK